MPNRSLKWHDGLSDAPNRSLLIATVQVMGSDMPSLADAK
jgi:hypothetical protein